MADLQMECWVAEKLGVGNCHLVREMKKKREDLLVGLAKAQRSHDVPAEIPSKLHVGQVRGEDESALRVKRHAEDHDADEMAALVPDKVPMVVAEVGLHRGFSVE
ncbi:hypothetical protein N7516_009231 [Penicillium verrucosum]|uniref:uncharacterized protein n=1 Tax=Penicillium verrucosum TaxID=60171 RepID=UPI0025459433|nr:uncharacterized protein N7516_009231 [Penicillium verrucosum]KAJ5927458.1 hypothetical protein N7516_009231 [Penicillium verrucosum]